MTDANRASPVELDQIAWSQLSDAVRRLEAAWRTGAAGEVADYAPPREHPLWQRILVELIKVDQEYRWRRAEPRKLEDYPQWSDLCADPEVAVELIEAECLTRFLQGSAPAVEEIRSRFERFSDRVDLTAISRLAEREQSSGARAKALAETQRSTLDGTKPARDARRQLPIGETFGRYEIRAVLGEGGMGTVYRAYDTELCREVALKVPHSDLADSPAVLERFVREARSAAAIRHPHVCPIHDAGHIGGLCYMTMALIDGLSLADWMRGRTIPQWQAAELVLKLARALAAVHAKGIVHRDIKPCNVMVDAASEPLLMDFGLARAAEADRPSSGDAVSNGRPAGDEACALQGESVSQSTPLIGTIPFMAPEQIWGNVADTRSDIYGMGVLFYLLLTGRLPFTGSSPQLLVDIAQSDPPQPHSLRPEIDAGLEAVCLKAMARAPTDRYQSAAELADSLRTTIDSALPQNKGAETRVPSGLDTGRGPGPDGEPRVGSEIAHPMARRRWRHALLALAGMALLLVAVTAYLKTGSGTVELQNIQPDADVIIDGKSVTIRANVQDIPLAVGPHHLEVRRGDATVHTQAVTIRSRGARVPVVLPLFLDVARHIQAGQRIFRVVFSRDGETLYALREGTPGGHGLGTTHVDVIDWVSGDLRETITLEGNGRGQPRGMVLSADANWLFVNDFYYWKLTRIDLRNPSQPQGRQEIPISQLTKDVWPEGIAVTPDGTRLVALIGCDGRAEDYDNDRIAIFDIADGQFAMAGEAKVPDEPRDAGIAISEDSRFAYWVTLRRKSAHPALCKISLTPPFRVAPPLSLPDDSNLRAIVISSHLRRAFISDSRKREIVVVDLDRFQKIASYRLPHDYAPREMALHPRGDILAVMGGLHNVFLLRAADGTVVGRVDGLRGYAAEVVIDPTGRFVLLPYASGGIDVIDLNRRGTRVVFTSDRAGDGYQLYAMDTSRKHVVRLTMNHASDRSPRWSPDGGTIAFVSDRQGPLRLCILQPGVGTETVFDATDPSPALVSATLDWSPDGRQIAFIAGQSDEDQSNAVRVLDVASRKVSTLISREISPGYSFFGSLSWGRSGMLLITSTKSGFAHSSSCFRIDPMTGKATPLTASTRDAEMWYNDPVASPDGTRIAVVRMCEAQKLVPSPLCLMSPDGSNIQVLAGTEQETVRSPRWSPDGTSLTYTVAGVEGSQIHCLDLATGVSVQLTNEFGHHHQPDICISPGLFDPPPAATRPANRRPGTLAK